MNQENINQWVETLWADRYKQGRAALHVVVDGEDRWCCLGVVCDLAGVPVVDRRRGHTTVDDVYRQVQKVYYRIAGSQDGKGHALSGESSVLPSEARKWLGTTRTDPEVDVRFLMGGVEREAQVSCTALNDTFGLTLPQIGDMVAYFGLAEVNLGSRPRLEEFAQSRRPSYTLP